MGAEELESPLLLDRAAADDRAEEVAGLHQHAGALRCARPAFVPRPAAAYRFAVCAAPTLAKRVLEHFVGGFGLLTDYYDLTIVKARPLATAHPPVLTLAAVR